MTRLALNPQATQVPVLTMAAFRAAVFGRQWVCVRLRQAAPAACIALLLLLPGQP